MRSKAGRQLASMVAYATSVTALVLVCAMGDAQPARAEDLGYDLDYYDWELDSYADAAVDPATALAADPMTGLTIDPATGQPVVADLTAQVDYASAQETVPIDPARLDALAETDAPTLLEAQSAAIIDGAGNVLFEKDANTPRSPASVTKVMTAVVALDSLKQGKSLDDVVTLVEPYLGPDAQMADFQNGETATFRDLLRVMLVYSANDAAYNVALHVAGSIPAFADLMNAKAAEIGLTNSHFMNPHGIDEDGHLASALDLARLSRYAMQNYPFIAQTVSSASIEIPIHDQPTLFQSTDALLGSYVGIRGVKTGYAEAFTFMGAAGRGNMSLYTAVLGCATAAGRFNDTAAMMDWAYAKFGERSLAEDTWAVRLNPYALDMGYETVISAAADTQGTTWPNGGVATYASAIVRPGRLLDTGEAYGWSVWSQAGRSMGAITYVTREVPVRVSAWPTFVLPLFENTSTLGRAVTDA